jgi:hypothetical protein
VRGGFWIFHLLEFVAPRVEVLFSVKRFCDVTSI